ncbi:YeeE/YedE family protein [Solirubrobacter ginsenosidimutans]|uniref:YeeE/YedE family protein n=1 Tax=Solirubrobacter ginsenosidimutans TaxID=490573 RepID=A0A9X3MRR4_9ACTN|nr:YeeE/YedE thiosulfate transporter family protein [Solirubrobacter ginsenosidimutans]MDA0161796.1 YeeE/YedE family protein [Solirubrobacter ginsenosidimutans]
MHQQLAWYVGGPVVGLCVVAMRWLLNERLGATSAWSNAVEVMSSRSARLDTRGWLLIGLLAGGVVFGIFGAGLDGYGWLTSTFTGGSRWVIVPVLLGAGALIGFGAKTAGGCTSGNGLSGNAVLSPASLVATATFFGTAIVVSFAIEALT